MKHNYVFTQGWWVVEYFSGILHVLTLFVRYSTGTALNGGSLAGNNYHTALTHQDMMMFEDWHSS